ncbi:MAG: hypothetical protein V8R88_06150 [Faecalibacterium prausnitzii]
MQPKKHYFAHIPTIAIFIVFAMSAPLGVLLFILKSIDKNAEKEETAAAQAQADYRSDLGPAPAQTAPGRKTSQPTATMFPPKSRRMPRSGTSSLPPCAPSAVLSFCSRASAPCSWMALTA